VPEWADAYINYKLLKKLLNAIDVKNRLHERNTGWYNLVHFPFWLG